MRSKAELAGDERRPLCCASPRARFVINKQNRKVKAPSYAGMAVWLVALKPRTLARLRSQPHTPSPESGLPAAATRRTDLRIPPPASGHSNSTVELRSRRVQEAAVPW